MTVPRVVVADDAPLIREGLRQVLHQGGCDVVATVDNATDVETVLAAHPDIDVVVLDIRMPPTHTDEGMVLLESLRTKGNSVGVLLLSMYASSSLAVRALAAGRGTGYLLKERVSDGDALVDAVRVIASGGVVVDPDVVELVMGAVTKDDGMDQLTERESEVLRLMATGLSNVGIADRMQLSVKTVESHVAHILDKLGIQATAGEHRRVLAVLRLLQADT